MYKENSEIQKQTMENLSNQKIDIHNIFKMQSDSQKNNLNS